MGSRHTLYDSSQMILKNNIIYMYVFADYKLFKNTTFISILDQDFNYIEYEVQINKNEITHNIAARIRSLFNDFQFTRKTEVVVDNNYNVKSPLYLYLMFIKQQIQFNLRSTSQDIQVRRIAFRHQSYLKAPLKNINRTFLNKLWLKLVEMEKCPWINENVNYDVQNYDVNRQRIKKILRIALYYLIAKNQLLNWNKNWMMKNNKV